jgi:outer membrane protein OmpA-like peptidoglycan-associated protein
MPKRHARPGRAGDQTGGQFWAPIAYLMAGLLALMVFAAALPRDLASVDAPPPELPGRAEMRERVSGLSSFSTQWNETLESLCTDPVLLAEGIGADCDTGTITFGDDLFDEGATVQLTEEGIRKLHQGISTLLQSLRTHDEVWDRIESIELRGHADPRALRDPYLTNMRVSQERPMAVMFYLISDWGLSERDRHDLERLLILSAASHSRPPAACPEATSECFPFWRRVEMTPRLRESALTREMGRFTSDLDTLLPEDS